MTTKRKRFIAGAVCPQCQSRDTLAVWLDANIETVTCVQCGFSKQQIDEAVIEQRPGKEQIIGIFHPE